MLQVKEINYSDALGAYNEAISSSDSIRQATRVARVVRVFRLFRLIRIIKLYRHAFEFISLLNELKMLKDSNGKKKAKGDQEESKVGRKLSDLTTKRVLVLVILMLLFVPIFTINTYKDENTYFKFGLDLLDGFSDNMANTTYKNLFSSYIEEYKVVQIPITNVYVKNTGISSWNDSSITLSNFRPYEIDLVKSENNHAVGVFNFKYLTNLPAALGIVRSIFVCCVLALGAIFFSRDATYLVIKPIEGMISKVNRIARNPLEAAQEEENEALAYEKAKMKEKKKKGKKSARKEMAEFETAKVEQTIIKMGALLALGFGEAGAKIIADNMGHGGDVDPMVPGNKVVAIFGFCDIRNFTDATEVLQEDVMLFVNEVADIVHGAVDRFSGAANKNIGDAFLLVWKFNSDDVELDETGQLVTKQNSRNAQYADMSLISFLRIIAEIRKSHKLDRYSQNKQILEKLPNFQVKLGFGLHVGWAIEGAIGSDFKIDASYLSPNVNTASRLEAATKQFGVPLLVSGNLKRI